MSLLGDGHVYSYSQLSSFSECPYSFYLQRIEKAEPLASNGFAERGTLIHDLLDRWAKGILKKEDMAAEYERRYTNEVITAFPRMLAAKGYSEKIYQQGITFLENFDEFAGYKILSAEEKFLIDFQLEDGTTRPFVGIIDLLIEDESTGDLIICDHKSKSMASFKKSEKEMYRQQLLYSLYVHQKYGKWPNAMMFHLFNEDGYKSIKPFDPADLNEALTWAIQCIHGIEDYTVLDWLMCKEEADFYCFELCSVRKNCPNGVYKKKAKG